jgi:hypothetical protein
MHFMTWWLVVLNCVHVYVELSSVSAAAAFPRKVSCQIATLVSRNTAADRHREHPHEAGERAALGLNMSKFT